MWYHHKDFATFSIKMMHWMKICILWYYPFRVVAKNFLWRKGFLIGRGLGPKLAQKGAWWRALHRHAMLFTLSWGFKPLLPPPWLRPWVPWYDCEKTRRNNWRSQIFYIPSISLVNTGENYTLFTFFVSKMH
jgi:hypothetical protein